MCNTDERQSIKAEFERAVGRFRKLLLKFETSEIKKKGSFSPLKNDALHIASMLINLTNQRSLPVNLAPICEKMSIHSIVEDPGLPSFSASLVPDEKGFVLRIRKTNNQVRDNAIIAHEIGHTLFYDVSTRPPNRILRYKPKDACADKEEWVSWDFARALLLPQSLLFRECSLEYPLPPSEIVDIARKTGVSVELICYRLIHDLGLWSNCALFISDIENGKLLVDTMKLYRPSSFPRFFIKGKKGLVNLNSNIKDMVESIVGGQNRYEHGFITFQGVSLWVKMLRYSNTPKRVLCLLEIPYADFPFDVLSSNSN